MTVSAPTIRFLQRLMERYQIHIIIIIMTKAATRNMLLLGAVY